jgi:hypothetical protein
MNLSLLYGERLDPIIRAELEQLIVSIVTHWMVEHREDGTHTYAQRVGAWVDLPTTGAFDTNDPDTTSLSVPVGKVTTYAAVQIGKTCGLIVNVGPMSVVRVDDVDTALPLATALTVKLPDGVVAAKTVRNACQVTNNGIPTIGTLRVQAGARVAEVLLPNDGPWTATTNGTGVTGQIWFPVQ